MNKEIKCNNTTINDHNDDDMTTKMSIVNDTAINNSTLVDNSTVMDNNKSIIDNAITIVPPIGIDKTTFIDQISELIRVLSTNKSDQSCVIITVPEDIDKDLLTSEINHLTEKMRCDRILEQEETNIKSMSVENILKEVKNMEKDKIEKIIRLSPLYNNNILIKIIINYYAHYYKLNYFSSNILDNINHCIIFGLLLNIPSKILYMMAKEGYVSDWCIEELDYYTSNNGEIRIQNICANLKENMSNPNNNILINYMFFNHYDILKEYNKDIVEYFYFDLLLLMKEMKNYL